MNKACSGLEVLVPGNIRKAVIGTTDGALEENHTQGSFENLCMVSITVERFAQLGDGGISVAHDVAVDLLSRDALCRFKMQSRNAQTAV